MKIALYGATGNIGSQVTAEAARRGHSVTALSRHAGAVPSGVSWQQGDAADSTAVAQVAADHDVIVSALGPDRSPGGDRSAYLRIVEGFMATVGTTRLLVVGGAGSLQSAPGVRLIDSPDFPDAYRPEALVAAQALDLLRAAPAELDWTYLSPAPEIGPGERTGSYRVGVDEPAGEHISFADYAVALIDEIETPAHRRERFTVAE